MQYLVSFPPERTEEVGAAITRFSDAAQQIGVRIEVSASPQFPETFLCIWGADWPRQRATEAGMFVERFLNESGILGFSRRHGPGDPEWDRVFFGWLTDEALSERVGHGIGSALGIPDIFLIVETTALHSRTCVLIYKTRQPFHPAFVLEMDDTTCEAVLETGHLPENCQAVLEQVRLVLRA